MRYRIGLLFALLVTVFMLVPVVHAEERVVAYYRLDTMVDKETIPQGQVTLGSSGQIKPKSDSIIAGLEYAFRYEVSDPTILSIDVKGNWQALKEGTVVIKVYGQYFGSSPEFEAELDTHGIQRAENEPAVAYIPTPYTVEVIQPRSVPVYRLRHVKTGQYTYTPSTSQVARFQTWGWVNEGVAWVTDSRLGTPIYRAYNQKTNAYFFTKNETEQSSLIRQGWRGEGVAFFSTGQVPVYRLYHNGRHVYTKSEKEKSLLIARGYRYEGVAWYAQQ